MAKAKGRPVRAKKARSSRKSARAKTARRRPAPKIANGRNGENGRFLPGNRFWAARSSAGIKPEFANGEDLWAACVEYFRWVEDNPLWEDHVVTFQGKVTHEPVPKMQAMTIAGLCLFLDLEERTWRLWRATRTDLIPVITRAEAVIRHQKFTGAAADLLNPNIIARDLGLADKSEVTGKDGKDLVPDKALTSFELARFMGFILEREAIRVGEDGRKASAPNGKDAHE